MLNTPLNPQSIPSLSNLDGSTRRFSDAFARERTAFLQTITSTSTHATETVESHASLLLNRLMFLSFLQHKGLLDSDPNYLLNRLHLTQQQSSPDTYYQSFLLPLFHQGLSIPASHRSPTITALLGNVPYLGHSLFQQSIFEISVSLHIPDAAFSHFFSFLATYHWPLNEDSQPTLSAPSSASHPSKLKTLTPSVLSSIFEKSINQQQMGAYYTKDDITNYIAANTILPTLFDRLAQSYPAALQPEAPIWQLLQTQPDTFIHQPIKTSAYLPGETESDYTSRRTYYTNLHRALTSGAICTIDDCITNNLDIAQLAQAMLLHTNQPDLPQAFYHSLTQLTILDPTCGSGAFLLAALTQLQPLYVTCLCRLPHLNPPSLNPSQLYYLATKTILTHNLYGVDLMPEAAETCKLSLMLKLLAHVSHNSDIDSLPDLSAHIHTGNALVGYIHPPHTHTSTTLSPDDLDYQLARTSTIDPDDPAAFQQWRTSHQPFHWFRKFPDIMTQGCFSIIIGNPPYVEYDEKQFPYILRDFLTLSCANLYPCIIERCHALLSPQGRQGMILPLAAFSTRNMIPFIEHFQHWYPCTWLSFYHFRPSMLFSGSKTASIPTVIFLARHSGPVQRFSTQLTKWFTEQRSLLFSTLSYCQITTSPDPINRHYYPKFGKSLENSILQKILPHRPVRHYLSPSTGPQPHHAAHQNTMFYRSAGGLYWKIFTNFLWPYQTTSNKYCTFQSAYDRDIFVALFNSSLFWWYYTISFDTFNLKNYMIFGFRFSYPNNPRIIQTMRDLCQQLMDDYRQHARHLKRGATGSYTIYARKSKPIIDQIDHILAQHYHFTDEELHFILTYDLKYRTGHT